MVLPQNRWPAIGTTTRLVKLGHQVCSLSHAGCMVFSVDRHASMAESGKQGICCRPAARASRFSESQNGRLKATAAADKADLGSRQRTKYRQRFLRPRAFRVVLGPFRSARVSFDGRAQYPAPRKNRQSVLFGFGQIGCGKPGACLSRGSDPALKGGTASLIIGSHAERGGRSAEWSLIGRTYCSSSTY